MRYVFRKAFTMLELVVVIVVVGILAMVATPRFKDDQLAELVDQTVSLIRYTQHLAMQDNPFDPQDPAWFKKRWTIQFIHCDSKRGVFGAKSGAPFGFTVFKLTNTSGGPNSAVFAKDPLNPNKLIYSGFRYNSSSVTCDPNLWNKTYSVSNRGLTAINVNGFYAKNVNGNCPNALSNSQSLSFDEFGRPHFSFAYSTQSRPYGGTTPHCGGTNQFTEGAGFDNVRYKIELHGRNKIASIYIERETGFVHVKYRDIPQGGFSWGQWDSQGY